MLKNKQNRVKSRKLTSKQNPKKIKYNLQNK